MLRASADQTGRTVDLSAIVHTDRDVRLPAGAELLDFVTAAVRGQHDLEPARDRLHRAVGAEGVVRAAAVAGNFEMMNRLVDATGVPIGPSLRAIAEELDLDA